MSWPCRGVTWPRRCSRGGRCLVSALLNDTDSGAREGFLQWRRYRPDKNVAEFNMAQLMP